MFRFLFGVFIGLWIGFAGGFVAGLWLMIRADRDVEEMMREPLATPETSSIDGATTSPTAPAAGLVTVYWWVSDQQQAEALEGWEWQERAPAEPF
jgi:hypothetical protein